MSGTNSKFYHSYQMVSAESMGASINSKGVDLQGLDVYSIHAVYSGGTPVGTLKLQISNDIVGAGTSSDPASLVTNWTDYTGSSLSISAAGDYMWKVTSSGERWVRLVYTRSSGSGTLNVTFSGKG